MGRRFTAGTIDSIVVGSAGLAGFNYLFGSIAICCTFVTDPGFPQVAISTWPGSGAAVILGVNTGPQVALTWDGTTIRTGSTTIVNGEPVVLVVTKATGTVTPRFHYYRFSTRTWVHENASGTNANAAATTVINLGTTDGSTDSPLDAEVWAVAMWPNLVMTDSECERLARGGWLSLSPGFCEQWSDGREVGDMTRTLGRHPVRQTARDGTIRGATKPPPGFRLDARRRRR